MDISHVNLYANHRNPIFHQFCGPEVMTSQPDVTTFWGRLDSFGDINHFLEKKEGSSNAFPVPRGIVWVFLAFMVCLQYVLSLFHFDELTGNCKT